eukprot:TRINITY_DN61080_c0_g1_i1.p1 TRINITY_DN61080_c0_g1~~TRINITY_DN61080_c0_g1_i1.p1  ORF type:complete len:620 (-),score=33.39 TRINITY_DN61080_c0_g1_i1:1080-2939(-)
MRVIFCLLFLLWAAYAQTGSSLPDSCVDDPRGIVAADPTKDCKDLQPTGHWSCDYYDADFNGHAVFIYELCPKSCGKCGASGGGGGSGGVPDCSAVICPAVDCPIPPGRCCGDCDSCQDLDGMWHHGDWSPSPCEHCHCENGRVLCAVIDCAAPPCTDYYVPEGKCCPVCHDDVCVDDPHGIVAADPTKDCRNLQRTGPWSCDYYDADFNGHAVFIYELCPKSCGRCNTEKCAAGSHWSNCGSACPNTCAMIIHPPSEPIACPAVCVPGCVCDTGLVRNARGRCVKPDQCMQDCSLVDCRPIDCAPGQLLVYPKGVCCPVCISTERQMCNGIAGPRPCPTTYPDCMSDPLDTTCDPATGGADCGAICVRFEQGGCKGRGRHWMHGEHEVMQGEKCEVCSCDNGIFKCMPCADSCPGEETWNSCGTACPDTCNNLDQPNRPCPRVCVAGCFCPRGYVRLTEDPKSPCVKPDNCRGHCGPYSHWDDCGSACPASCAMMNMPTPSPCIAVCVRGCTCNAGYIKDNNGNCVKPSQCPQRPLPCPPATHGCFGVPVVQCLVDPCRDAHCPMYPGATCCSNYCGGCHAEFYYHGMHLTHEQCMRQPQEPQEMYGDVSININNKVN